LATLINALKRIFAVCVLRSADRIFPLGTKPNDLTFLKLSVNVFKFESLMVLVEREAHNIEPVPDLA